MTLMELLVGAFNKQEVGKIKAVFSGMRVVQIDEDISEKAVELITSYAKSHGLHIPDALIAATALVLDLPLFTRNIADFRYLPGIVLVEE